METDSGNGYTPGFGMLLMMMMMIMMIAVLSHVVDFRGSFVYFKFCDVKVHFKV